VEQRPDGAGEEARADRRQGRAGRLSSLKAANTIAAGATKLGGYCVS
jgi:hypothetical protein